MTEANDPYPCGVCGTRVYPGEGKCPVCGVRLIDITDQPFGHEAKEKAVELLLRARDSLETPQGRRRAGWIAAGVTLGSFALAVLRRRRGPNRDS